MDVYLGKSYQIEGEPFWEQPNIDWWARCRCVRGVHLWDEVLSIKDHYLICDACELTTHNLDIKVEKYSEKDIVYSLRISDNLSR